MKNISTNRKINFQYEVTKTYVAGIKLIGSEVKSLRNNQCSIAESYCSFTNNELFVINMTIPEYKHTDVLTDCDVTRIRLLLLKKKELNELEKSVAQKGFTIIPMAVLLTDSGLFKLKIGLCKGKKTYNKKESLKLKDIDRDIQRQNKITI